MGTRDDLRALVDELTDEEATEALEYQRFLIQERRQEPAYASDQEDMLAEVEPRPDLRQ
jgi:hypothetical protein